MDEEALLTNNVVRSAEINAEQNEVRLERSCKKLEELRRCVKEVCVFFVVVFFYYIIVAKNNTPLYSLSSGLQINMVKQKKCIATIFEHIFWYLFFRASYEDVDLKKKWLLVF